MDGLGPASRSLHFLFLPGQQLGPRKSRDTLPAPFWAAHAPMSPT